MANGPAIVVPLVLGDVVDDDTEQAVVALFLAGIDVQPAEVIDDDTEQAIIALWQSNQPLPK